MFPVAETYVSRGENVHSPAGKYKKSFGINFSSSKSFKLKDGNVGGMTFLHEQAIKKRDTVRISLFHIQVRKFLLFIFLLPFRIHRKPAFQHAFTLFEDFLDGPERGERKDSQKGRH